MGLNENQARALSNGLRLLEERLVTVSRLIDEGESGRLYRRDRPDLSAEDRATLHDLIGRIRREIVGLADQFALSPHAHRPLRQAVGLLSVSWEALGDLQTDRLAGYGAVDPALAESLDPPVERLMGLVLELERRAAAADDADRRAAEQPPQTGDTSA